MEPAAVLDETGRLGMENLAYRFFNGFGGNLRIDPRERIPQPRYE
jgi:hypothetical protein